MTLRDLVPGSFLKKNLPASREEEHPFALLRKEVDDLFDGFFRGLDVGQFENRLSSFSPHVDVTETDKEIRVSAELPGMDEKNIDVSLNKDTLTIKGEKKEEQEDKGRDYYRMERSYGSFSRSIPVPVEVDHEKVAAKFKKGVLTITLPKTKQALEEKKKISIESA